MANLNQPPSRVTPNLLHILNAFTDSSNTIINTIVELNSNTINKYELIIYGIRVQFNNSVYYCIRAVSESI